MWRTLTEKWRSLQIKETYKGAEGKLVKTTLGDPHQSEEGKCMWTHGKDVATWQL